MSRPPTIALVVPSLTRGGGVPAVAAFLHRVIEESGRYDPRFVSLAMSSADACSVRLRSPATWLRGIRVEEGTWEGRPYRHVGALLTELEFQRYRPRRTLTRLLQEFDLVQVVAGTPSWALVARDVERPVALQVATLAAVERRERLARGSGLRNLWFGLMTRVTSRLDHAGLRQVDTVFVENQWMLDYVREHGVGSEAVFAPPGVDTDRFVPEQQPGGAEAPIVSVGRFSDPRKNVALLFESYRLLRELDPSAPRLVLAGKSGPSAQDWRLARSIGIAGHVEFMENVSLDELARLYRGASLFVLSSDEEGLGVVILEAMASGLAVVSTDCGGPATSVVDGTTGFLVPRGDARALAEGMQRLVRDPALRLRMGRLARERAVEEFSLRASGERFLRCYDRMLAGS